MKVGWCPGSRRTARASGTPSTPAASPCAHRRHIRGFSQTALHRAGDRLYRVLGAEGCQGRALLYTHGWSAGALAGLGERWSAKDKNERKETFTVVTTEPNSFAAEIHDRMPMMLEIDDVEAWLRAEPCCSRCGSSSREMTSNGEGPNAA